GNSQTFDVSECSFSNAATGNVYPNPNNGSFTISLGASSSIQTVVVTDMMGKEVYRQDIQPGTVSNNYIINLPSGGKGVFMTKVLTGGHETAMKKIVVY